MERWMIVELDELTHSELYELGCQISDALNRVAYAEEQRRADKLLDIEDTDMET